MLQHNFINIFHQIPSYIFWKDCDLVFRGGNQLFAEDAGVVSADQINGKTDYDLPWAPYADCYRLRDINVLNDLTVFSGKEMHIQAQGRTIEVWVRKSPLYNSDGKLIGVIGSYFETTTNFKKVSFRQNQLNLPPRQSDCLRFLMQGWTAKQIARAMNLSTRTVEYYIGILKKKYNCKNKAELMSKVIKTYSNKSFVPE